MAGCARARLCTRHVCVCVRCVCVARIHCSQYSDGPQDSTLRRPRCDCSLDHHTHRHHHCWWCLLRQLVPAYGEHACSGIGANGTRSPLPVTVNPCAHATSPLTVVEGSAVAPSPPSRAWLHAGTLRVTPILRLCRVPCCCALCNPLLLLLPPPLRPPPHLGIVGRCGQLV